MSFLYTDDTVAQYNSKVIIATLTDHCVEIVWAFPQLSVSLVRETRSLVLQHVVIHYTAMTTVQETDKAVHELK